MKKWLRNLINGQCYGWNLSQEFIPRSLDSISTLKWREGVKREIHQSWASALPVHLHLGASQYLVFCYRNYCSVTSALSILQVLLLFSLSSYFYFKSKYIFSIILFFRSKVTHISDNRKISPQHLHLNTSLKIISNAGKGWGGSKKPLGQSVVEIAALSGNLEMQLWPYPSTSWTPLSRH